MIPVVMEMEERDWRAQSQVCPIDWSKLPLYGSGLTHKVVFKQAEFLWEHKGMRNIIYVRSTE